MVAGQESFVVAAYIVAGVVVLAVCVDSYVRWHRVRVDYQRLFTRKDKQDA